LEIGCAQGAMTQYLTVAEQQQTPQPPVYATSLASSGDGDGRNGASAGQIAQGHRVIMRLVKVSRK